MIPSGPQERPQPVADPSPAGEAAPAGEGSSATDPEGAPDRQGAREVPPDEMRELTDPRELRAVTHPVRLAILEALRLHEALTATEAGELIGESPTTCSFHLRQLAKYGFVKEAGGGAGRRRPWMLAFRGLRFATSTPDTDLSVAAAALENLLVRYWFERFNTWERTRQSYSQVWQEASSVGEAIVYVTPAELVELEAERQALVDRFRDRAFEPSLRPAGAQAVEVLSFAFPLPPTPVHPGQAHALGHPDTHAGGSGTPER